MPGPKDNEIDKAVDRVSMMKKAGFSPAWILLLTIASSPGFYSYFFDKSTEVAQARAETAEKKADVSYEVIVAEIKELRNDNAQLAQRVQNQHAVIMILLQKGVGSENMDMSAVDDIIGTPVYRNAPRPRGESRNLSRGPEPSPVAELVPPEVLEDMVEQRVDQEQRKALPPKLDGLMKHGN